MNSLIDKYQLDKEEGDQSGINMVDLMMWLVIAAMLLAAAIQGIGYYQKAAWAYQAKNDVSNIQTWAAANVAVEGKIPNIDDMEAALAEGDLKLTIDGGESNIGLLAVQGSKYCVGVESAPLTGDNVFYSSSDSPSNIVRAAEMPAACGTVTSFDPSDPNGDGSGDGDQSGAIIPNFSNAASIWYKPTLQAPSSRYWGGIAASADGSKLVSVVDGGSINTSTDFGRTWVERTAASGSFKSVKSSADGTKLFAASTGDLWLSNDSGVTWAKITNPGGSGWWTGTAMSSDGTKLYVIDNQYGYRVWASMDGGVTWAYGPGSGGTAWNTLSTTGDGKIVLAGMLKGFPYISTDSGATYQYIASIGTGSWRASAASADGKTLFFGGDTGRFVSTDSGVTWNKLTDDGTTWYSPAISADGSKWVVAKNDGYIYLSNDAGATWRKQLEPAYGPFTRVVLSADTTTVVATGGTSNGALWVGSFGNIPAMPSSPAPAVFNTVAWNQIYGITGNWARVASSVDGRKLVSGGSSYPTTSYIYTSMDYGASWTQRQSGGTGEWNRFASSANGEKLVATQNNGFIHTSTDSGVTWTKQDSAGSGAWKGIASSYDGAKLVAVRDSGGIYTSTDSGVTWTLQPGAVTGSWTSVASSADGTRVIAAQSGTGFIYTSTDSGVTWAKRTGATGGGWSSVASSADGTKLIASQYPGSTWTSKDSGATWTKTTGPTGWVSSVASSADGTKLISAVNGSYIYSSKDGGDNWTMEIGPGYGSWSGLSTSADGSKLFAILYRSFYTPSNLWKGQY